MPVHLTLAGFVLVFEFLSITCYTFKSRLKHFHGNVRGKLSKIENSSLLLNNIILLNEIQITLSISETLRTLCRSGGIDPSASTEHFKKFEAKFYSHQEELNVRWFAPVSWIMNNYKAFKSANEKL